MAMKTANTPRVLWRHFFLGVILGTAGAACVYAGYKMLGNLIECNAVQACPEPEAGPEHTPGNE